MEINITKNNTKSEQKINFSNGGYIVKHHDSGEGFGYSEFFKTFEEAWEDINEELQDVGREYDEQECEECGRDYKIIRTENKVEIYIPDTDIYCEWLIYKYGSYESIKDFISYLDNNQLKVEQELLDLQNGKIKFESLGEDIISDYKNWLLDYEN